MTNQEILSREWSGEFVKLMQNRIVVSHYKYGWMSQTYPELAQAAKCIRERLEMYEKTGNREWLVDIANFAMIEYLLAPKYTVGERCPLKFEQTKYEGDIK